MSLNNMKARINYRGGARQVSRMIEDKERSFKESLWRAYQSATAILDDGREFRCLINPNKVNMELDDKMLSIPFNDKCLTTGEQEDIPVSIGTVVGWKETGTYWLIYSRYLQEVAYFRGLMRQCESEPMEIEVNGETHSFYYCLTGPNEKGIDWQKSKHFIFNDVNYNVEIYISNTSVTNEFFQRFTKCKIQGKPYEVQAVDRLTTEGILAVYLKETYTNAWETDEAPEEEIPPVEEAQTFALRRMSALDRKITGPAQVYPYDTVTYEVLNSAPGAWLLSNKRAVIVEQNESSVTINVTTGKSGSVSLIYRCNGQDDIIFNIEILSL